MARELRKQEVADAVKAYAAKAGKEVSINDAGGLCLMPGDILVTLDAGNLNVTAPSIDDMQATSTAIREILMEMPQEPNAGRSHENKTIMPSTPRKSNGGQMRPVSQAVRDIQVAEMTFDDIRNFLCPAASDKDTFMFLKLCQARNLNPFCNEAYLIPYEDKKSGEIKCSMVVGKEAFMRKAEANPAYRGFKAGIILSKGEELIYREGTFQRKGETLEGGWCEVYRSDRDQPIRSEVSLAEYDKGFGLWAQGKKATMVRKVSVVQAHRESFPADLSGCYDRDELGLDPEREVLQ
ncbi:MAG: phage recombination protein Bet [Desulfoplanes sp.]